MDEKNVIPGLTLESLNHDPIFMFFMRWKRQAITCVLFFTIVVFAFMARMNTFWLPHWMGDQSHYISLAMKLDKFGFNEFSLRGVDIGFIEVDNNKKVRIVYPKPGKDLKSRGTLLEGLKMAGITYYDQPFFHKPPGIPYALVIAHKLFAKDKDTYGVVFTNLGSMIEVLKPQVFFDAQFYAAIVPLFFSIGTVVLTFFIGRVLFSNIVGIMAAFIYAIHPISIMTAQKLWADDMVSFFVTLSVFFLAMWLKNKKLWLVFAAGLACGTAILAKQTGGYLIFGVMFLMMTFYGKPVKGIKDVILCVLSKEMLLFAAGMFIVSGFWFIKAYQVFGNPLYQPAQENIINQDSSGWFKELTTIPPGYILFPVGFTYLCPVLVFGFLTVKDFFLECVDIFSNKFSDKKFILLWLVVLGIFYSCRYEKEYRLILPAFSSFAVLAAYGVDKYFIKTEMLSKYFGPRPVREALAVILFLLCAAWAVPIGVKTGIDQTILLRIPF